MNKLAAVVILYHPDKSIYKNIQTYLSFIGKLYIVDNSETLNTANEKFYQIPKSSILHRGENIGIAKALNLALDQANQDNYTWLMTMDQDSLFAASQLAQYLKDFQSMDLENVAIFSPVHNPKFLSDKNDESPFSQELFVMTSANIVKVKSLLDVGGYDENLFIDEVDHELGFRLNILGYRIIQHNGVFVTHYLGKPFIKKSNIKVYPPIRLYYMIRNYLYLKKRYHKEQRDFFKARDKYLTKFFFKQLLFNGKPLQSIKMIIRGVLDYRNSRFGKQYEK